LTNQTSGKWADGADTRVAALLGVHRPHRAKQRNVRHPPAEQALRPDASGQFFLRFALANPRANWQSLTRSGAALEGFGLAVDDFEVGAVEDVASARLRGEQCSE